MKTEKINLRSFAEPFSDEEREFYGLAPGVSPAPSWPQRCVNSMEPAAGSIPLAAEKSGDAVIFHVPVSAENLEAKNRNFGWVTKLGVWISYVGVIGFFVCLYFAFALTEQRKISGDLLFLLSITSIVVAFLGFYFVQFMRTVSPPFRQWLNVPAAKVRIKKTTPYYQDLSFEFGNTEYAKLFAESNAHLDLQKLEKETEKRLAALNQEVEQKPENPAAQFQLGLARERLGEFSDAIAAFGRALELDENSAATLRHIGACHFALGNVRSAEEALEKAESLDPNDVDTALLLAALFDATNRNDKAIEKLNAAKEVAPQDPDIRVRIGEIYLRRGDQEKAAGAFDEAVSLDPDHETALLGLAMVLVSRKDPKAAKIIEKLENVRPDVAKSLKNRLD